MDTDGYGYGPRYGYYGRRVYYGYGAPAITVAGITATGIIGDRCVDGSGDGSEPLRRFMHGLMAQRYGIAPSTAKARVVAYLSPTDWALMRPGELHHALTLSALSNCSTTTREAGGVP
jgi:hypothetical protein